MIRYTYDADATRLRSHKIGAATIGICLGLILPSVFLVSRPALAQSEVTNDAKASAAQADAVEKRARGEHAEALKGFQLAYSLVGSPVIGLEVAREQAALGLLLEACDTAQKVADSTVAGTENDKARADAQALRDGLSPRVPSIEVTIKGLPMNLDPGLRIDGFKVLTAAASAPIRLNPGEHKMEIVVDGYVGPRQVVKLTESTSKKFQLYVFPVEKAAASQNGKAGSTTPSAAGQSTSLPAQIQAMTGKRVVLRTKDNESIEGHLLSADDGCFIIDKSDGAIAMVPRQAARGIRLSERARLAKSGGNSDEDYGVPLEKFAYKATYTGKPSGTAGIAAGSAIFALAYGISAGAAVYLQGNGEGGAAALFVPIAGPFIAIGTMEPSGGGIGFLTLDGLVQVGGIVGFIVGLVQQNEATAFGGVKRSPNFMLTPVFTGNGVGAAGTF